MGMIISGDILQAKVNKILGDIKGLNAYIDDVLVLNKGTFAYHSEKIRICFPRTHKASLKINTKKCRFVLKDIPHLRYVITMEEFKHDPKNIQVIMDLQ